MMHPITFLSRLYIERLDFSSLSFSFRLRKFTFGNNGVEFTHDVLIKYQTMTCGLNIHLLGTQIKPSLLSGQTPAYSSLLCS